MFDFLKNLFLTPEERLEEAKKDVLNKRQETKDNLAKNLKEKLFFTDYEINEVISIIDLGYEKINEVQKNVQYSDNYGVISGTKFEIELLKIQNQLKEDIKNKIIDITEAKLERARKRFSNNNNNNNNNNKYL